MAASNALRFRSLLRDLLPPAVLRALRHRRQPPTSGDLGIGRREATQTRLNNGVVIEHRNSAADRGVIDQIFGGRDYDLARFKRGRDLESFYGSTAQPLILDCGANIGASCVWFSQIFPKAQICAVEPEKANVRLLTRNCRDRNVKIVEGAIAARRGELTLSDPGEGEWGFRAGSSIAGAALYTVQSYGIRDLVDLAVGTPFILKMDIEGAEADLFSSDSEVFDSFPLIIIELHDWMLPRRASSRPFLSWHAARDRDFVFHGENVFSFSNTLLA